MASDELIEKHSEDIDSLQKEFKALKKRTTELSNNVENLSLMAFQQR